MYSIKRKHPHSKRDQSDTEEVMQMQEEKLKKLQKLQKLQKDDNLIIYEEFIEDFVNCFEESKNPMYYVASQEEDYKLRNSLISNSVIIYGPSEAGKTASVYWAIQEQPEVEIIIINCQLYITQNQFIGKMIKQIGSRINQKAMKTSLVIKDAIKFEELNEFIINSGKKFVFVIKCCQKLVIYKKQLILYNLCQWMKTDINNYIGVVYLSKKFDFTQKLQKRVKSRMAAKTITLFKPNGEKILKIFLKRLEYLEQKYKKMMESNKSQKKKQTSQNYNYRMKNEFLQKIKIAILDNRQFQSFLQNHSSKLNNQYLQCLKLVLLKDLTCSDFLEDLQNDFNELFLSKFKKISDYICPNYYTNLILQCGIPQLIVLAILANIGVHGRGSSKLSAIYKHYLEFQRRQPNIVTFYGKDPKVILERNVQKLIQKRLIELQKKDTIWQCEISLAITPSDIVQIFKEESSIQTFVRDIVDL